MLRALWDVTQQFQNKNGSILAAGRVYVYYKNRTALAEIFSDEEGTVVNTNPVLLDNNGRATVFADTIYSYTIVVCDYYGKELFSQDITLHDAISTAKDVIVMGSNGSVKVDTTTLPNGVKYDLSVNTDIIATKESVANKKDKQNELNFNGSATKTVKSITQNVNGELNVEFEDISAGGISSGTAIDLTDNAVSVKYSKGLEINSNNELQVNTGIIATKESVESSLLSKQDALTPGSNIGITNNIISATGIPTKTSELENDSGFITDVSSTVDITNIVGTISASGNTIVNILYNSTLGLINMTTFNNPNRTVSGNEFYQLFLFNNDFTSKVDLKLQTEIRVRDDSYNSYFTVIYIDTTGTITEHGYKGIYLWPVHNSWKVLPGNTKYFFLSQQANNELNQYVNGHL